MVADFVRFMRFKQAVRLKEKTEEFLRQRGIISPRLVSLKLAVAILDGATIEDDDELHTLWAKLLTNARDPTFTEDVRYAYAEILRSLSPSDARLLNEIYDQSEYLAKELNRTIESVEADLASISKKANVAKAEVLLSSDCLIRQRLIVQLFNYSDGAQVISHDGGEIKWINPPPQLTGVSLRRVQLTPLGLAFVRCCK